MKILIIKTGISETFDLSPNHPGVISLGDVVRSTVILNLFLEDKVHWLTSSNALALVEYIPQIEEVFGDSDQVKLMDYDLIVNLERDFKTLAWVLNSGHENIIGFTGPEHLQTTLEKISLLDWLKKDDVLKMNWSEKIFHLFARRWNEENYFLPRLRLKKELENMHAIGLNWKVGVKWPTKIWPEEKWHELETKFNKDFSISWQQGFDDLYQYMNWINSCRVIVTHDSLGLHIAKALNKQIVCLFGPTSSRETFLGKKGHALSAEAPLGFSCLPCYKDQCHNNIHCMDHLSVDIVADHLRRSLRQDK